MSGYDTALRVGGEEDSVGSAKIVYPCWVGEVCFV